MSFIQSKTAYGAKPGFFLASAECERQTAQIAANHAAVVTTEDGSKYVPAGAVIPANGATAVGILYEDVDVSTGAMPGSIVTKGTVYEDRLPASLDSDAKTALTGIKVITAAPAIERPSSFNGSELASITVTSTAHATTTGKTVIAVSGYTLKAGERYVYKIDSSAAPAVAYGEVLQVGENAWTAAAMPADVSSTDNYKITVAAVDSTGAAVAAGNATIDVK